MDLHAAIAEVGGPRVVSDACDITPRSVYKWLAKGSLPRTEFTGETNYAEIIAALPSAGFTAEELLRTARPNPESSAA